MNDLRRELRRFEMSLPRDRRKRLGQFFTEAPVARLLAAISVRRAQTRILDPMAGHGSLLDAAAERLAILGGTADLFGIEIDERTAQQCETRVKACVQEYHQRSGAVVCGNAFSPAVWDQIGAESGFDLVIGNPPYVRYQTSKGSRDEVREGLKQIAELHAPEAERRLWETLIDGYSGLADLSVPSWLLCAMLCRPGGLLALVVPRTWMNRESSRVIRYLQCRVCLPLLVVEEHGAGWFDDALVPTTLILSHRLPQNEVSVPLRRRQVRSGEILRVGVAAEAGVNGSSLVSNAFSGADPEGSFASWSLGDAAHRPLLTEQREPLYEEYERVLQAIRSDGWASAAEEGLAARLGADDGVSRSLVPAVLMQAVALPDRPLITNLGDAGIKVGQGLRTGCNAFFYVDEVQKSDEGTSARIRTSAAFAYTEFDVPSGILRPVLRKQAELAGFRLSPGELQGRVLDLRDWLFADDLTGAPAMLFAGTTARILPERLAAHVLRAASTKVGGEGREVLIPQLTAVAPNERVRKDGPPRRWYMLPDFAPRHLPVVFVPRINDKTPSFVRNAHEPVLIDANFSTFYDLGLVPSADALLALLNSTWVRACCEAIGSPMGGGALKLEASHLRDVPIPVLSPEAWATLERLGAELPLGQPEEVAQLIKATDRIIVAALAGRGNKPDKLTSMCQSLTRLTDSLRQQRQRKGAKGA